MEQLLIIIDIFEVIFQHHYFKILFIFLFKKKKTLLHMFTYSASFTIHTHLLSISYAFCFLSTSVSWMILCQTSNFCLLMENLDECISASPRSVDLHLQNATTLREVTCSDCYPWEWTPEKCCIWVSEPCHWWIPPSMETSSWIG